MKDKNDSQETATKRVTMDVADLLHVIDGKPEIAVQASQKAALNLNRDLSHYKQLNVMCGTAGAQGTPGTDRSPDRVTAGNSPIHLSWLGPPELQEAVRRASGREPKTENDFLYRGIARMQKGDFDNGTEDLAEFLRRITAPEHHVHIDRALKLGQHRRHARAFVAEGRMSEAIKHWTAVVDGDPTDVEARYERALAYRDAGEFEKAVVDFAEAWEQKKRDDQDVRAYCVVVTLEGGFSFPFVIYPATVEGLDEAISAHKGAFEPSPLVVGSTLFEFNEQGFEMLHSLVCADVADGASSNGHRNTDQAN